MMRGRRFMACAVRRDGGEIIVKSEPLSPKIYLSDWSKVPFLRAVTILWDTLVLGTRMLMFSANVAVADELEKEEAGKQGDKETGRQESGREEEKKEEPQVLPPAAVYGTLAVALAFGIGLFFVLPLVAVNFLDRFIASDFVSNLVEGLIRLGLLLAYIYAIGFMPDVRRVFQYHGAEHKTIAAFEAGAELVPEKIQPFDKEHPRCGTGFLLVVVVVSILVFALLGRPALISRIASRILLVPVAAALSYELIKFSAAHRQNPLLDWLVVKPSLALQSLTTREPDNAMVEVAVASLNRVVAEEKSS
jgi:uncharacterized protein YqhQ